MRFQTIAASLAVTVVSLGSCYSDESLDPPPLLVSQLFRRYVSLGNSIGGGIQSIGWNDSTQQRSFPVFFAAAAGAPFSIPNFQGRGCPPPLTNNITGARVGGGTATTCDLRGLPNPSYQGNFAVPGANIIDALSNDSTTLATDPTYFLLTTFVLGGLTEVNAMMRAQPTFVSAEFGSNDVLGALLDAVNPGNPAAVTDPTVFASRYARLADSIAKTGAKAVLVGVPDVTVIPFTSTGTTYWCIKNQPACGPVPGAFPPNFSVDNNCAPPVGNSVLVPWTIGVARLLTASQPPFPSLGIDCSVDADVVLPAEYKNMQSAVAAYNTTIKREARSRGWAFVNLDSLLQAARVGGLIPPFPDTVTVASGLVVSFGPLFSLDGFHPSTAAHVGIADAMVKAVNLKYGTTVPCPSGAVGC